MESLSLEQFSCDEPFKYSRLILKLFKVNFKQAAAMIEVLLNNGIQPQEADLTLRNVFFCLTHPGRSSIYAKITLGVTSKDDQGNFRSILELLTEIGMAIHKVKDSIKRVQLLHELFGASLIIPGNILIESARLGELDRIINTIASVDTED
jgi:TP901 family phage tail tape measure protein